MYTVRAHSILSRRCALAAPPPSHLPLRPISSSARRCDAAAHATPPSSANDRASAKAIDSASPPPPIDNVRPPRLSTSFVPTLRAESIPSDVDLTSLALLLRGGYVRQSSSGVYTLLPNGLRMVDKIQRIVQQEMLSIGASQLAMPTLLSSSLWKKTGRYHVMGSELYKLKDRKGGEFVLAPTHEEEVTKLVAGEVESEAALPVRVYQITRKHRDEPRPRMGLLRTREFLMKDLYTFDADLPSASATYDAVRGAYDRIFSRIFGTSSAPGRRGGGGGGGWKSAEADTGAIGGSRSHEYHVEDAAGEDTLVCCRRCDYVANEEKAASLPSPSRMPVEAEDVRVLLYGVDGGSGAAGGGAAATAPTAEGIITAVLLPASRRLNDVKMEKHIASLQAARGDGQQQLHLLYDSSAAAAAAAAASTTTTTTSNSSWDWKDRPEGPLVRFDKIEVLSDFECVSLEPDTAEEAISRALTVFGSPPGSRNEETGTLSSFFPHQFSPLSHHDGGGGVAGASTTEGLATTLVDIRAAEEGDLCPSCRHSSAKLYTTKAIEVGHTFLLGTKYSQALGVGFTPRPSPATSPSTPSGEKGGEWLKNGRQRPFQMGCYGIGVSRILGALAQRAQATFDEVAATTASSGGGKKGSTTTTTAAGGGGGGGGFIWPREVRPWSGVIVTSDRKEGKEEAALRIFAGLSRRCAVARAGGLSKGVEEIVSRLVSSSPPIESAASGAAGEVASNHDNATGQGQGQGQGQDLGIEEQLIYDDRPSSLGSKLADADLVGYPIRIIVGNLWSRTGRVEVRRLVPRSPRGTQGEEEGWEWRKDEVQESVFW